MPPAKIITNKTSISARCLSAKAMSAFMTILTGGALRLAPDRRAVDEQTALGDDPLAGPQALEHLDHSALGDPDLDRPQFDHPLLVGDPYAGGAALVDACLARHRRREVAFIDVDSHVAEHFRLQQAVAVGHG